MKFSKLNKIMHQVYSILSVYVTIYLYIFLGNECERCNCFGHADECYFDPIVEAERKSLNANGKYILKI